MPKTTSPGEVRLEHGTFSASAVPDVFDARDLDYRSRLQVLPKEVDCRPSDRYVMTQKGNSCTGHAVAAMVNAILTSQDDDTHVSPYMVYALARRYDEFEGEADVGSSLRGAFKGWYYHGVLPEEAWPDLDLVSEPDLDQDNDVCRLALQRPLGAFYRVNATRLDDLQSAVTELFGIVASSSVHDGWYKPVVTTRTVGGKKETMHVITRTSSSQAVGGHAFCIVGYNDVGFLVQNSWGPQWGKDGFATLPYDDWLESAYDAWVARPGVPSIVSARTRSKVITTTGGGLVDAPGPDLTALANHVVNVGNDGKLSQNGRFISTKAQLDKVFEHVGAKHDEWSTSPRRIVLYAHGGMDSEKTGLDIAQRQLNWWLSNKVYPITFAWQTGVTETLEDQLSDMIGQKQPAGGWPFSFSEQIDRMIEKTAKRTLTWLWDEMKENAARATTALPDDWRQQPDAKLAGGSVVVARLKEYLEQNPGAPTEVHLVGHSAGSIFLTGVIERLTEAEIPIVSVSYLAAAIRTDEWMKRVLPALKNGAVKRFSAFGLSPTRELDDVCGAKGVSIYHKSLLYLVSRAFERPTDPEATEVPLAGMARFAADKVGRTSYERAVESVGGTLVWSPTSTPDDCRSNSSSHGGFDDDNPTMTSLLLRVLGQTTVRPGNDYVPNLPAGGSATPVAQEPTTIEDQSPEVVTVEVHAADSAPGPGTRPAAAAAVSATTTSAARHPGSRPGEQDNRVIAAMEKAGWKTRKPG